MQILWLIAVLVGLYFVFVLIPALICFRVVFGRSQKEPLCQYTPNMPCFPAWQAAKEELAAKPWRDVRIRAQDGVVLHGSYLDAGFARTALCVHGFLSSAMNNFALQGCFLLGEGFNLLFVDQRAHGASGGAFCSLGLLERQDLLDWLTWLDSQPGGDRVLVYGISMGASTASYASDRMDGRQVRAMLLDCPFLSPEGMIAADCRQRHIPWLLMRHTVLAIARIRLGVDMRRRCTVDLQNTVIPALFLHGGRDRTVPYEEGEAAFRSCASEKEWLLIPEAEHTLAFPLGGAAAEQALRRLIRRGFEQNRNPLENTQTAGGQHETF